MGKGKNMRSDGGYIDRQSKLVEIASASFVIITQLPEKIVLSTGESIEVFEEEILYKAES
jgi:hypothetical protein